MNTNAKSNTSVVANVDILEGVYITIPAESLALYSMIKGSQIAVLSSLVSDAANGFQIEMSENDIATLSQLVSELSGISQQLIYRLTETLEKTQEGAQQ